MVRQTVEIFARVRPAGNGGGGTKGTSLSFGTAEGLPFAFPVAVSAETTSVPSPALSTIEVANARGAKDGSGPSPTAAGDARLSFRFNRVFDPTATQEEVYSAVVKPLALQFLQGINCTVMAYGQTGSGKTWSISGGGKYKNRGVIPRAVSDVFASLDAQERERLDGVSRVHTRLEDSLPGGETGVHAHPAKLFVSYMEIYNENVYDLLDERNGDKPIELWDRVTVREGRAGEIHLKNLRQYEVSNERDVLNLLFLGHVNRMTAETPMNHASSRSHCIFTITLERRQLDTDIVTTSKFNLVDLAGSERIFKTGVGAPGTHSTLSTPTNASDLLRKEGKYINLSLHHLEQVIIALQAQANRRAATASGDGDDAASVATQQTSHTRGRSAPTLPSVARGRSNSRGPTAPTSTTHTRVPSVGAPTHANRERSLSSRPVTSTSAAPGSAGGVGGEASAQGSRRSSFTSAASGGPSSVAAAASTTSVRATGSSKSTIHVPYRNSMLTSILRDSLGGNCRTVLIATINPEPDYLDETVSTCRFAVRCGQLTNDVHINESRDLAATVLLLRRENARLRGDLESEKESREQAQVQVKLSHRRLREHGLAIPDSAAAALSASLGPRPLSGTTATAAVAAPLTVHIVPRERRRQLEERIADCIRRGIATVAGSDSPSAPDASSSSSTSSGGGGAASHACEVLLDEDGVPISPLDTEQGAQEVKPLVAVASVLRLVSLSDAYASLDLLMEAVKRAVSAAAEASSEADHERARGHAASAAVAALKAQVSRYERDTRDWESRHSSVLGEYNTINRATAGMNAQIADLQAQLDEATFNLTEVKEELSALRVTIATHDMPVDDEGKVLPTSLQSVATSSPGSTVSHSLATEQALPHAGGADKSPLLDTQHQSPSRHSSPVTSTSSVVGASGTGGVDGRGRDGVRVVVGDDDASSIGSSIDDAHTGTHTRARVAAVSEGASTSGAGAVGPRSRLPPTLSHMVPLPSSRSEKDGMRRNHSIASSLASDISALTKHTLERTPSHMQVAALRDLLVNGGLFIKHGRQGSPHLRFVWVDGDMLGVHWRAVGKDRAHSGRGSMPLSSILEVIPGRKTGVFARNSGGRVGRDDACLSLIAADRTLDLEAQWPGSDPSSERDVTAEEVNVRNKWVSALRVLVAAYKRVGKGRNDTTSSVLGSTKSTGSATDGVTVLGPTPPAATRNATSSKELFDAVESILERHASRVSTGTHASELHFHEDDVGAWGEKEEDDGGSQRRDSWSVAAVERDGPGGVDSPTS